MNSPTIGDDLGGSIERRFPAGFCLSAIGRSRSRWLCQNSKTPGFRGSFYPSGRGTKPGEGHEARIERSDKPTF